MIQPFTRADGTRVHVLKVLSEYYHQVRRNQKRVEIRRYDDRDFQVGDLIELIEVEYHDFYQSTGRSLIRRITCITKDVEGLSFGYCLLSIAPVDE